MRGVTEIKKRGVKITMSPTFLDYYEPPSYVVADAVGLWVEVHTGRIQATYAPDGSWRFNRRVRCNELRGLSEFLKKALSDAPRWPVFELVAEAAKSLELLIYRICGRSARRYT